MRSRSAHAVRSAASMVVAACALLVAYSHVISTLVRDWANDDNYSHGFLIVPLAIYFGWERRARLAAVERKPNAFGVVVVLASLGLLAAGTLGAELFLTRISLVGVLTGAVLFLWGPGVLRVLAFPLALLLLMVPIPAIIFNQLAFPLQIFASQFGTAIMELSGVPVLREGNVIVLAHTNLEVAEACSGIRSLISLLTLGIVYGYFTDHRSWVRVAIAVSTIPIAIVANGLRVAGTGVLAHYYGREAADGFFHTFSGWLVFIVAFLMLFVVTRALLRVTPTPAGPSGVPA